MAVEIKDVVVPAAVLVGAYFVSREVYRRIQKRKALPDAVKEAKALPGPTDSEETAVASTEAMGIASRATRTEFEKWLRFGAIDNSALIASTLMGFSLDDVIAKKIGVKGYGALIGASLGNCASDTLAALPEGKIAALGVTAGCLAPIVPIVIAMKMKKKPTGQTAWALGGVSAVLLAWSFWRGRSLRARTA